MNLSKQQQFFSNNKTFRKQLLQQMMTFTKHLSFFFSFFNKSISIYLFHIEDDLNYSHVSIFEIKLLFCSFLFSLNFQLYVSLANAPEVSALSNNWPNLRCLISTHAKLNFLLEFTQSVTRAFFKRIETPLAIDFTNKIYLSRIFINIFL